MTDSEALLHEANRQRGAVVDATRVFIEKAEGERIELFEVQKAYDVMWKAVERLDEAEKRMEVEATL